MKFSQALILAVATSAELLAMVNAAPTASDNGLDIHSILRDPEQMNCIDWEDTGSGYFATIYEGHDHCQDSSNRTETRSVFQARGDVKGLGIDISNYKKLGSIAGLTAQYACHKNSKEYGLDKIVQGLATDACNSIVSKTPPGSLANGAWNIWQSYQQSGLDPDGTASRMNFGLQADKDAPPVTQQLCALAIAPLLDQVCQHKDKKGESTTGGIVRVRDDKKKNSWLSFLADPQALS